MFTDSVGKNARVQVSQVDPPLKTSVPGNTGSLGGKPVELVGKGTVTTQPPTPPGGQSVRSMKGLFVEPPRIGDQHDDDRRLLKFQHLKALHGQIGTLVAHDRGKVLDGLRRGDMAQVDKHMQRLEDWEKPHVSVKDRTLEHEFPKTREILEHALFFYGSKEKLQKMMTEGVSVINREQPPSGPHDGRFPEGIYGTSIPPWSTGITQNGLREALFTKQYTQDQQRKGTPVEVGHCLSFVAKPWNWKAEGTFLYSKLDGMTPIGSRSGLSDSHTQRLDSEGYAGGATWHWVQLTKAPPGSTYKVRHDSDIFKLSTMEARIGGSGNTLQLQVEGSKGRSVELTFDPEKGLCHETCRMGDKTVDKADLAGQAHVYIYSAQNGEKHSITVFHNGDGDVSSVVSDEQPLGLLKLYPAHMGPTLIPERTQSKL